jgi:hypothetical protein
MKENPNNHRLSTSIDKKVMSDVSEGVVGNRSPDDAAGGDEVSERRPVTQAKVEAWAIR